MDFRKVLALRGPNLWANFPVLEAWVDLGDYKDCSSDEAPGFNDRLMTWLPTLIEHRCSVGERGGFFQRLRRGTYPAHILEHVTLELQALAGSDVGYGKARETSEEGALRTISGTKTVVEAIVLGGRSVFLERAAKNTGGTTAHAERDTIARELHRMIADINSRYTLVYQSHGVGEGWRSIAITSRRRGIEIINARKGYFAE